MTNLLKTRNRRRRLPNTITIDSIHEKNFLSPKSVLEAVVIDVFVIPGMLILCFYQTKKLYLLAIYIFFSLGQPNFIKIMSGVTSYFYIVSEYLSSAGMFSSKQNAY